MKIATSILAMTLLVNLAYANEACTISRPDAEDLGVERYQLPAMLRSQLLRYYDADCEAPLDLEQELKAIDRNISLVELERRKTFSADSDEASLQAGEFELSDVGARLSALSRRLESGGADGLPFRNQMRQLVDDWAAGLSEPAEIPDLFPISLNDWKSNSDLVFGSWDFGSYLSTNGCSAEVIDEADAYSKACEPSVNATLDAFSYTSAIAETVDLSQSASFKSYVSELDVLDRRWTTYFDYSRSLYLWELAINRWVHNKSRKNDDGFFPVPERQYFFLHPGLAFEYIDDAAEGNQFEESLILEVVGINAWTWQEGYSDTSFAYGASLIASYSDRANVDDLGWGVMFHLNHKYSLGVTRHGSSTGYFVSFDLQKLLLDVRDSDMIGFDGFSGLKSILGR